MVRDNRLNVNHAGLRRSAHALLLLVGLLANPHAARADEPVVTTLADYEDDSVAVRIADVENVLAADCDVSVAAIPARGQRSLMVEIGATEENASAACDLRFRLATPFHQADRVATYAWITQGAVEIQLCVRDDAGRVFQTLPMPLQTRNRWVRLVADLSPGELTPVGLRARADQASRPVPTWPIQIQGYRIRTRSIGRQTVYLDDLEIEHHVSGAAILRGEFGLDQPTHIYQPGALVRAALVLENISRQRSLPLTVQLAWLRSDGGELATTRKAINLPASGADYRSRQPVDFSRRIRDPGLYRLVARVRGPRWIRPALFETTIAVTSTNRVLPRGRATFFGVQSNLMREPLADQLLEIDVAREIGVQLLALETPWRIIEPSPNSFDFETLDALVNRLTQRDIAVMIRLTEPPEWLPTGGADARESQSLVFEALSRHFGRRIHAYQPLVGEAERTGQLTAADLSAVEQIRDRVLKIQPDAEVVAPPIPVAKGVERAFTPPAGDAPALAFETADDSTAALAALESFAQRNNLQWQRSHRWYHRAAALSGSGALYDATAVLRHYVRAASAGVGGVLWFDLRDDTNDARYPQQMRGLVRRDFSPKTPLLGFANAVGMLHGLLYTGEVPGTPAQFDSALFIGGQRQVAVLFPKPNRVLPAVLAPLQIVPGELSALDFDRRARPLLGSTAQRLVETLVRPFFITLDAERAQADPKLRLARPWLRMPAAVYCGKETTFSIEIDAPTDLRRSYLQLILLPDAPVESSLSSRALRGKAGDTLSHDITLTRVADAPLSLTSLTVRVRLEDTTVQVPFALYPLRDVQPVESSTSISKARFAIGRLTPPDSDEQDEEVQTAAALHVGYQKRRLHVAVVLPPDTPSSATLQLGIAVENADVQTEVGIENLTNGPKLSPAHGTTDAQVRGWRCGRSGGDNGAGGHCHITIPAGSLGLSTLEPGTRLLLAARYRERQGARGEPPRTLEWGSGLDGTRSTIGYHWVELTSLRGD